jgi:hypothetical protein
MEGVVRITTTRARGLGIASAVVLVLMLAVVAAKPAAADTCDPLGDTMCAGLFTPLRGSITTYVPGSGLRRSFLAQVDLAERLLPPSPIIPGDSTLPSRLVLWSLGVQARFFGRVGVLSDAGATAISAEVDAVLAVLYPTDPL